MENYSKGEIAKIILLSVAAVGVAVIIVALPGVAMITKLFNSDNPKERRRAYRSLKTLERNKYVRVYKKNGKDIVEITKKGKRKILQYKFNDMNIKKPEKWDGIWRMVIFDIPEIGKKARDAISFKLKDLKFYPLQKSVYIFPYKCRDEIDFVGEFFNVRKYIQYIELKNIDCESKLKKNFKL